MVVQTADQGIANARKTTKNDVGMCLWYTQEWLKTPHVYPDATAQWNAAKYKHAGDRNPPAGAPVSWTGGSKGHGHSALSLGGGRIRTIDCTKGGTTSETDLGWVERAWGLTYKGWHEDLGGVDIPYLRGGGGPTNPNGVKVGDLVYAIANGGLIGRETPGGNSSGTSLPYGTKITILEIKDGWARAESNE